MSKSLAVPSRLLQAQPRLLAMGLALWLLSGMAALGAPAGSNPVPLINQPLVPTAAAPGGAGFLLTVNGSEFVNGAVIQWNGVGLATTFVSSSQLTANVPAADIASMGTASITVANPPPGGGVSNVAFFPVTGPTSSVSFLRSPPVSTTAGSLFQACLVTGDFNGDGIPDLAVPTQGIFLGNGDGTFTPSASNTVVPSLPNNTCFAVGDFNGDGIPDLASTAAVYIGNGDGTFQASLLYPNGLAGNGVLIAGDFNGDGKLDLAVGIAIAGPPGNSPTAGIAILLGNGDGTFLAPSAGAGTIINLFVQDYVQSLAVGDLNGDGKLDLAIGIYRGSGLGRVSILLGKGDGTFQPGPTTYSTGQIGSVILADFNGDGKLDLATSTEEGNNPGVYVWIGNGDGTFQISSQAADPTPARSLYTADMNGDGKLDLVVGYGTEVSDTEAVGVLLGNGDGTFGAPTQYSFWATPPTNPVSIGGILVAGGDFNGDGRIDFALLNGQEPTLTIFLQSIPLIQLTGTPLVFGTQAIGTISPAQSVQVQNTGSALLTFSSIQASANFTESDNCTPSLAPSDQCTINVTFAPTVVGSVIGTLTLADNVYPDFQTIQLSGTAFFPSPTVSPANLNFGSQDVGTISPSQPLSVTNNSVVALNISSIAISSGWTQSNACGSMVAPGATCTINVSFAPTAMGIQSGTLTLTDSASNSPQMISLNGTGAAPLVITAGNGSMTYGGTVPTITPSYSGFVNGDTAASLTTTPTCSTTATSHSPAGPYPSSCTGAVDSNYTISYMSGTVTDSLAALTITANNASRAYGAVNPAFTATYNGFVNGDTAGSLTGALSCTTTATAGSPPGMYPITCSGQSSTNYNLTYSAGTLTITAALLTITAGSASMTYGGTLPTITPGYSGLVNGDTAASLTMPPICSTTATSHGPAGSYPSTCSGAVDSNYSISYVGGTVTDGAAALVITASSASLTYGGMPPTITPGYSGLVNGDTAASLTTPPTCSTAATSHSPAGSYPSSCSGAMDGNYSFSYVGGTVTDGAATLAIAANSATRTYGGANSTLTATYSGFVNGDTASNLAGALTCTTMAAAGSPAGMYPITCSGQSSTNYNLTYSAGTLTVIAAPLTITAVKATRAYGSANPAFTALYSGFVNNDTESSLIGMLTCATTATTSSPAGSYPITCSGQASTNYNISYVAANLTVAAVSLTITANNVTQAVGAAIPTFTATYTGFVNNDTATSLTGALTCTTTATASSPGGSYPITCSGQSSTNYAITYVAGILTIQGPTPVAGVSPGNLTFAIQNVGTTSAEQAVILNNTGNGALSITSIAASANFGETNNCGSSLAASSSCTINVTFSPTTTGPLTGALTVTDNSNGTAGSLQTVVLSGTGQDFTFTTPAGFTTTATVTPGQTTTYTISVGGIGGASETVTFTCTGVPSGATCTVSPNPLPVGTSFTNVTVTVTTTAASVSAPHSRPFRPAPPLPPGLKSLWMIALLLSTMGWAVLRLNHPGRDRWPSTLAPLAAVLLLTLALAGCGSAGQSAGGSGNNSNSNTTSNPGTPAGTYTLTVTGTTGSGSSAVSHSVPLTLTVS